MQIHAARRVSFSSPIAVDSALVGESTADDSRCERPRIATALGAQQQWTIWKLSRTSAWPTIAGFASLPRFWLLRLETEVRPKKSEHTPDWKYVYYEILGEMDHNPSRIGLSADISRCANGHPDTRAMYDSRRSCDSRSRLCSRRNNACSIGRSHLSCLSNRHMRGYNTCAS